MASGETITCFHTIDIMQCEDDDGLTNLRGLKNFLHEAMTLAASRSEILAWLETQGDLTTFWESKHHPLVGVLEVTTLATILPPRVSHQLVAESCLNPLPPVGLPLR